MAGQPIPATTIETVSPGATATLPSTSCGFVPSPVPLPAAPRTANDTMVTPAGTTQVHEPISEKTTLPGSTAFFAFTTAGGICVAFDFARDWGGTDGVCTTTVAPCGDAGMVLERCSVGIRVFFCPPTDTGVGRFSFLALQRETTVTLGVLSRRRS